jgi:mannose-6-phosphate isomerase-like protein (cupin superfamily)
MRDDPTTAGAATSASIEADAARIERPFTPHNVIRCNGATLKLSRLDGVSHWHHHEEQEELFLCWRGLARIELEGEGRRVVSLRPGDVFVVPAGVEHRSSGTDTYVLHLEVPGGNLYKRQE